MPRSVTPTPPPAWPDAAPPEVETTLIGRAELVADVADALIRGKPRIILLSGLGGVGKTRLAIEVARRVAVPFGGRIAWVTLGQASRDGGLVAATAVALGLAGGEPDHVADAVAETIGDEPALVVLDRAEVSPRDLARLDELVSLAPPLRVLATSRIAIDRTGMRSVPVDTLRVPRETDDAATVAASPAVELLIDRATRAGADVEINERTAPSIARLVAHLDGLPLAIELAGPLLRMLPAHRLVEQVHERLDPVVATIQWSHDQLTPDDRLLYRRISVFGVPFRERHVRTFGERAQAHGLSELPPDVGPALRRLAAAGLLRAGPDDLEAEAATGPDDPRGGDVREYELPALVREDAIRRLEASGEATAAMWARANDLLALCEMADAELASAIATGPARSARLRPCRSRRVPRPRPGRRRGPVPPADDRRPRRVLAIPRSTRRGPDLAGRRPASRSARPDRGSGTRPARRGDARELAERLRSGADDARGGARHPARARAPGRGRVDAEPARPDRARHRRSRTRPRRAAARVSRSAARSATRRRSRRRSTRSAGSSTSAAGRTRPGCCSRRASRSGARLGDDSGASVSLGNLALVARDERDLEGAAEMLREAISTRDRLGDRQRVAVVRHNLALVLFDAGDLDGARVELRGGPVHRARPRRPARDLECPVGPRVRRGDRRQR